MRLKLLLAPFIFSLFGTSVFAQTFFHPTIGIQSTFLGACTENSCGGTYYDDGGAGGGYTNGVNNIYRTFCPDAPGQCIRLSFTSFDLELPDGFGGCYDELLIGNGPTQNSPIIWQGCGTASPGVITSTDPSGCITVRFNSDGIVNANGWSANISCVPCAGGPSASLNTDCVNAEFVCDNAQPINANSQGPGLTADACISGCALSENYSNWYVLNVTQNGSLGLTITPTPFTADYDFSLYGPVIGNNCSNLGTPIRCSYAANTGNTGMRSTSFDASEDVLGDGWVSTANVTVGTYYLMINQWAYEPNSTFQMDFTGSTVIGLPSPNDISAGLEMTSNSPLCANETLQLTSERIAGATFNWSGPGGWTSNLRQPTRSPAVDGFYALYYTVNGCDSPTDSIEVIVDTVPNAFIDPMTVGICSGQNVTLAASGGSIYNWDTGDNTATITVSPIAQTTYNVTVTDGNNCSATASSTVTIGSNLSPSISPTTASVCEGDSITLTAAGGTSYTWSTGATTPSITVAPTSNMTYTVTASDGGSCTGTSSRLVTVNTGPVVSVNPSTGTICAGDNITLTAGTGSSYSWNTGDLTAGVTVSPTVSTSYYVTVTDGNSCTDSASINVNVDTIPTAVINPLDPEICDGSSTTLTASGGSSFSWNTTSLNQSITVSPTNTTTYDVTVTDGNNCSATASSEVTVSTPPNVTIAPANPSICAGGNVTLTASSGNTYSWNTGDNSQSINVSPVANTNYTVTVTDANNCSGTASVTVTVNNAPTIIISPAVAEICDGESITLTASAGFNSYLWSTTASTQDITVNPTINETFSVTVTDANGCSAVESRLVTVNAQPTVTISPNQPSICEGESITLTATGADNYEWSNTEITPGITVSPTAMPADYIVTGTNSSGCSATAMTSVTINPNPAITINASATAICGGQQVTLTASGADTYEWSDGSITNPTTVTPFASDIYGVTGSSTFGCTAVDSISISVTQSMTLTTQVIDVLCNGEATGEIDLTVTGGQIPLSYNWSSGQGIEDIDNLQAGNYVVTVTDATGCAASTSDVVNETAALSVTISSEDITCNGDDDGTIDVTPDGGTPNYSYAWNDGPSTDQNRTSLSAGNYEVTVFDNYQCSITATTNIAEPTAIAVSSTPTNISCNGYDDGSIQIAASGGTGTLSYQWNDGPTIDTRSDLSMGTYTASITDDNGCQELVTETITEPIGLSIIPQLTNPSCVENGNDGSIQLTASGGAGGYIYNWSTGESSGSIAGLSEGQYIVTITDANSCTIDDAFTLTYDYDFIIEATAAVTINAGESTTLGYTVIGNAGNLTAAWSPFESLSCEVCDEPEATPNSTTLYTVTATNDDGCSSFDTVSVIVLQNFDVIIPNAFSPNNDNINDDFEIIKEFTDADLFEVRIFNRWGEVVFESFDPSFKWNGTYAGKVMPPDVYVYHIRVATPEKPEAVSYKGSVTLIR